MKDDGGPAFPAETEWISSYEGTVEVTAPIYHHGMTLRDWFAGQAVAGLVNGRREEVALFAREAYSIADALLAQRAKKGDE